MLNDAIKKGGSSIRNFKNISGKKGNFQKDFKVYDRDGLNCKRLKCNGIIQKKSLIENGYPKKELIEIEALRYNYLSHKNKKIGIKNTVFKILVLGDYDNNSNKELLKILEKSLE